MGLVLGITAGYSVKLVLELCIHLAAVMFLLPKAAGLIGEGMTPITDQLKARIAKRFPKKGELHVALDTGIIMGNKSVIVAGLILMPVALLLSMVVPGNRVLPIGDLPNLISIISLTVLVSRGNVIRAVLTGIPYIAGFLWISTRFASLYTRLSIDVGLDFGAGQQITAFTDGGNHVRFLLFYLVKGNWIAWAILPVVGLLLWMSRQRYKKDLALLENREYD